MPHKGDVFDYEGLRFEVLRADARQIHVLLVEKLPPASTATTHDAFSPRRSEPATAATLDPRPHDHHGLAGALCVFAFAPFGWWPLQILGLATLFYQVLRSTA
jgi:hypothetical protein